MTKTGTDNLVCVRAFVCVFVCAHVRVCVSGCMRVCVRVQKTDTDFLEHVEVLLHAVPTATVVEHSRENAPLQGHVSTAPADCLEYFLEHTRHSTHHAHELYKETHQLYNVWFLP